MSKPELPQHQSWMSSHDNAVSSLPESQNTVQLPVMRTPSAGQRLLPGEMFLPFVQNFFDHMFPIMPVVDRAIYLDPALYADSRKMSSETYCFLCALCAATAVQLDDSIQQPPPFDPDRRSDDILAQECLRERKTFDHVGNISILSIMTSFFLFAYYGNHEKHVEAWIYLQESITFAETMKMDAAEGYIGLNAMELQWRRRAYWLLFITERAYAVQRLKRTRLCASVELPLIFESEEPRLLNGFLNLAGLFSAVSDSFVDEWRRSKETGPCDEVWLADIQQNLASSAQCTSLETMSEAQRLDIIVTREWLQVLAWQMGVNRNPATNNGTRGWNFGYPLKLAESVVEITRSADALAMDSHGIGMEQKLNDIACCLGDVLHRTGDANCLTYIEGRYYLTALFLKLSNMRGKRSRYLEPLMQRFHGMIGYKLGGAIQSSPNDREQSKVFQRGQVLQTTFAPIAPKPSISGSVDDVMLLSTDGSRSMPGVPSLHKVWAQRRGSGRIWEED